MSNLRKCLLIGIHQSQRENSRRIPRYLYFWDMLGNRAYGHWADAVR